jgi:hypothetical protein
MRGGLFVRRLVVGLGLSLAVVSVAGAARAQTSEPKDPEWEVGGFAETLFISRFHNLAEGEAHYRFNWPAVLLGGRGAYLYGKNLAVEAELAIGSGSVGARTSPPEGAGPDDVKLPVFVPMRLQLVGQVPAWRLVPFALLGVGVIYAHTTQMGSDADLMLEMGVGTKLFITKRIAPRLDLRLDATQREGGGLTGGAALHGEVLVGVSVVL